MCTRLGWLVAAVLLAIVPVSTARAHMGSTKYIHVDVGEDAVQLRVELDPVDVAVELGDPDPSEPDIDTLLARETEIADWLARTIRVTRAGERCAHREVEIARARRGDDAVIAVEIRATCRGLPDGALMLRDDAVFADDPRHESFVRIGSDDESTSASVLSVGRRELDLGRPPGALDQLARFVSEGAMHLFTGLDHLLFLLALILVAGQRAAELGLEKTARELAVVITGFTVGHSVTLIASALDWVVLPSRWVEVAIAGSIIVVALYNVLRPRARRELAVIAVLFGLIHGFGFSSVLRELALPAGRRVLALLGFNLGIEIAQLAFVLALLFPLAKLAAVMPDNERASYRQIVVRGGSVVIALVAGYWVLERALG